MPYIGNIPAEAYSQMSYQDLTGGSGTSFTLDYPVGNENEIEVFVNNVRQEPTVAYTTAGTALTMTGTIAATDDFYVVFQGKAQQTIGIPEKQTNGDYNFSSNTLYVDASTSRVGVNTSSPSSPFQVEVSRTSSTNAVSFTLSDGVTGIQTDGVYKAIRSLSNGGSSVSEVRFVETDGTNNNTAIAFATAASAGALSEKVRILPSGGITFNGDTAAANALDDYEEGTWTPTLTGYSGGSTQTYSTQTGYYTKIGNMVYADFHVRLSNKGNISGSYSLIQGLPYQHAGSRAGSAIFNAFWDTGSAISSLMGELGGGAPDNVWITYISGTSNTSYSYMNTSLLTNTTGFMGTLVYRTSY